MVVDFLDLARQGLVDAHRVGYAGHTALFYAAKRGNPRVTRLLLDFGLDLDARDCRNSTPLMYASKDWAFVGNMRR
ncbi:hypothetical protein BJX99DRAFT_230111 [Aspergillus californicus]